MYRFEDLIQTYTNYELIIVDNKSNDKTKTIIKSYNDLRIKYYYLKTKLNLGGARNFALKKSKGKYIHLSTQMIYGSMIN